MKFSFGQIWSCLIQQVTFIAVQQCSTQMRQIGVFEDRTRHLVSLFSTFWWKQCSRSPASSPIFWWMRHLCTYSSLLNDHCIWFPRSSLGILWWIQHLLYLSIFEIRVRNAFHRLVEMHLGQEVGHVINRWHFCHLVIEQALCLDLSKFLFFFNIWSLLILFSKFSLYIVQLKNIFLWRRHFSWICIPPSSSDTTTVCLKTLQTGTCISNRHNLVSKTSRQDHACSTTWVCGSVRAEVSCTPKV